MNTSNSFFGEIFERRYLIAQLIKKNIVTQYKKTRLGVVWSLAEPLLHMAIMYLVFGIGLRGGRNMEIPFICYLVVGIAVVNLFNSVLNKGTNCIRSQSYLLKKVHFRMSILPIIVIISEIIDHLFFFAAVVLIIIINRIYPDFFWLQTLYYLFSLSILMTGIIWFTSSLSIIIPDLNNVVSVMNRVFFYFSPVFWNIEQIPDSIKVFVQLNPLYYIITGYRNSLFYHIPFWQDIYGTLYFWGLTFFFLIIGSFSFKKIRPQFADLI